MTEKKNKKKEGLGKKAWDGRFEEATDPMVERFTGSFGFDLRLFHYDIQGSIAHAGGLRRAGLLTAIATRQIIKGLKEIEAEFERGEGLADVCDEDIHMAVERRLTEKIGKIGGRLHTGRSRNDQVALDIRLYLKDQTQGVLGQIRALQEGLVAQAEANRSHLLPGYTHLQRAQPISLGHHLLAYHEMLERDRGRFDDLLKRVDQMPLGVGALAGTGFPLDREALARDLGFSEVTHNSLDTVSDRDFVVEFLSSAALLMMHLSRWAEDWILWASAEFGFITLPDRFCTGSSMMPQKKNPDILELVRGKTGRVYGSLVAVLTVLKGLPLSYNRDLQEDKEPLFDAVETTRGSLAVMTALVGAVRFQVKRMAAALEEGGLLATDVADYLVMKGLPFREAHQVAGQMTRRALDTGKSFAQWTLTEFQAASPLFKKDILTWMSMAASVARRSAIGGTAMGAVAREIQRIKAAWRP